jgi:hypothetical protein
MAQRRDPTDAAAVVLMTEREAPARPSAADSALVRPQRLLPAGHQQAALVGARAQPTEDLRVAHAWTWGGKGGDGMCKWQVIPGANDR